MRRRQVLSLAGTCLLTSTAGCTGLIDGGVNAPLELIVWNHSDRQSHVQLYILDHDDELLLAESTEIDDHTGEIYEVTEEASEGDEFTVIVHETEIDESSGDSFELVCSDVDDRDDLTYVLQIEIKSDDTLYTASRANCR